MTACSAKALETVHFRSLPIFTGQRGRRSKGNAEYMQSVTAILFSKEIWKNVSCAAGASRSATRCRVSGRLTSHIADSNRKYARHTKKTLIASFAGSVY